MKFVTPSPPTFCVCKCINADLNSSDVKFCSSFDAELEKFFNAQKQQLVNAPKHWIWRTKRFFETTLNRICVNSSLTLATHQSFNFDKLKGCMVAMVARSNDCHFHFLVC